MLNSLGSELPVWIFVFDHLSKFRIVQFIIPPLLHLRANIRHLSTLSWDWVELYKTTHDLLLAFTFVVRITTDTTPTRNKTKKKSQG